MFYKFFKIVNIKTYVSPASDFEGTITITAQPEPSFFVIVLLSELLLLLTYISLRTGVYRLRNLTNLVMLTR